MYITNADRAARASESVDAPTAALAMPCSECKTFLRTTYFSLDGRPLCPKCAQTYRVRIDRGTGSGAMGRAVLYGGGAAFAGMLGLAILLSFVGAFRIIASVGVAYMVAKAIGKATANYGGRRYQVLAVGLTYLALGLAMIVPVFNAAREMSKVTVAAPTTADRFGPAGQEAAINDELNSLAGQPEEDEDPAVTAARVDSIARADSANRLEATRAAMRARDGNMSAADRLTGSASSVFIGAIGLIFVLPILSSFMYGIYAGVLSIFGLAFAMKKAWELTALVTDYELTGPFRVGTGPILPTIGR